MKKPKYHDPKLYYIRDPSHPTLPIVAKEYGISKSWINKRSTAENWVQQKKEYWDKTDAKTAEREIETIADMNIRHLREYRMIQGKGLKFIKDREFRQMRDAVSAVDTGIKGERTIKGEPTEKTDVHIKITVKEAKTTRRKP